jgi:hypothetical protein
MFERYGDFVLRPSSTSDVMGSECWFVKVTDVGEDVDDETVAVE